MLTTIFARRAAAAVLGLSLACGAAPLAASADVPGPHPAYVHALHDLRYARFLVARPSYGNVDRFEGAAVREIDRSLFAVRQAAIDDGKDIYALEPTDVNLDQHARLRRAIELLRGARHDITDNVESDPAAIGWRNGAYRHIDAAIYDVRGALRTLFADQY